MRLPEDKNTNQILVRIKESVPLEDLSPLVIRFGVFSTSFIKGGGTEIICYENVKNTREELAKVLRERGYTVIEEEEE